MSGINETNKIVDLQQRQANQSGAPDRVGELLKLVRATALKRINGLVTNLFENIDDALFDLAEKAENNSVQTGYFNGMREVRKKRQLVERMCQEHLSKIFRDFAAGKLEPMKPEAATQPSEGLSLVNDQELEESLAIGSMVAKAESRHAPQLHAVNQRLSMIRGGASVENDTNPIAPAPLCQAFRLAMREFELELQARLIIYKLFDRFVMSNLDMLYGEVNHQLIQAGVLPQIRDKHAQGTSRVPGAGPAAPGVPAHGLPLEGVDAGYAGGYAGGEYDPASAQLAEIYSTVRSLLAMRRGMRPDYNPQAMNLPSFAPIDLLSALTILQNQAMLPHAQPATAADAALVVQHMKHELVEQASKFQAADQRAQVAAADEDTIDLVGMLFQFIVQDRNLPPVMQAMLSRLQIPYLKVAILDRHLFTQKAHPARLLLDQMAQACIGWSEESDRDHRLYDKIKDSVEVLLKDFDDDVGIFERMRADFENFVETSKKRAELAEQRAAEATRGREKLHQARRIAAAEIRKRIDSRQLPAMIQSILTRPWANYLVLTLLRQGEESKEWKQALRFADEFIWSAEAKNNDADKARLRSLLPVIEKHLRHGLTTVAYHDNDIKQLLQGLNSYYERTLRQASTAAEQAPAELLEIVSKVAGSGSESDTAVEEIVMHRVPDADSTIDTIETIDDEFLAQAKSMKVGTWVEFSDAETGTKERAKLSWISPITSKYLFVNRKGLKVADKTVFALAAEMRHGATIVLEEVPLFDRALDAIVERLKASHPAEERPAEA
ncbi:MAG TPA: DUF1631 domain-containing protein [Rudaea sp.]|nr:DUF1631 domain-containing protein [Rudaea sp.]